MINDKKIILIICVIFIAIFGLCQLAKSAPLITNKNSCSIIRVQKNENGEMVDVYNYDEDKILDILDKCTLKRTLDFAYSPIYYDDVEYNVFLDDGENILNIRLGAESLMDMGYGTNICIVSYDGDIVMDLEYAVDYGTPLESYGCTGYNYKIS